MQKSGLMGKLSEQEKVLLLRMELCDLIIAFITSTIDEFGDEGLRFCKEVIKNRLSNLLMVSRRVLIGEDCHILELSPKNCEVDIKNCPIIKTKNITEICEIFSEGEDTAAKIINPDATVTCRRLTTKKRPQCRLTIKIGD